MISNDKTYSSTPTYYIYLLEIKQTWPNKILSLLQTVVYLRIDKSSRVKHLDQLPGISHLLIGSLQLPYPLTHLLYFSEFLFLFYQFCIHPWPIGTFPYSPPSRNCTLVCVSMVRMLPTGSLADSGVVLSTLEPRGCFICYGAHLGALWMRGSPGWPTWGRGGGSNVEL